MDVTLEEGYLNISHPRLGMASIRCQRRGDVLVHSDGYWLILFREKKGQEEERIKHRNKEQQREQENEKNKGKKNMVKFLLKFCWQIYKFC